MPYVVIDIPSSLLPPDLSVSVAELEATFLSEIWNFFILLVPIVASYFLIRAWLRNQ